MPYALQSDIEFAAGGADRLRQLADFAGDNDPVKIAATVARAQIAADSYINPYLANRMATPVTAPWPELVTLAAEEAVYQMRRWRGMGYIGQQDVDARKERDATMKLYETGVKRPPDPQPAQGSSPQATWVESDVDSAPVSRDGLKGVW
jgi:phage gp36-like protein